MPKATEDTELGKSPTKRELGQTFLAVHKTVHSVNGCEAVVNLSDQKG